MIKNRIRLTESQLHNIVKETIHSILTEGFPRHSFNVLGKTDVPSNISSLQGTAHFINDRNDRMKKINQLIGGLGDPIDSFIVDTEHPNGNEIHTITSNGIIIIQNERTKKFITPLIARPNQVLRYYKGCNTSMPSRDVLDKCREHEAKGYNYL